jgi:hypothetical protein
MEVMRMNEYQYEREQIRKLREMAEHMLGIKESPRLKAMGMGLAAHKIGIGIAELEDGKMMTKMKKR